VSEHGPGVDRRRFITGLAGSAAALAATAGAAPSELFAQNNPFPVYPAPQGGWDVSWVERMQKAKYRAVFDSATIDGGIALTNAQTFLAGYKDVYNATDAEMGVVVVIRHRAMAIVFNDDIWARWKLGEKNDMKDRAGNARTTNPWGAAANAAAGSPAGGTIDALIARGVTFLCCNLALMRNAGEFAREMQMPLEDARKLFIESLVPGVVRQTNGIFAITRAQAAGATLLKSA